MEKVLHFILQGTVGLEGGSAEDGARFIQDELMVGDELERLLMTTFENWFVESYDGDDEAPNITATISRIGEVYDV